MNTNHQYNGLIAPCGMNCGICLAYLRTKNRCEGCWGENEHKPKHCVKCVIKNCELLAKTDSKFCYDCEKYPCTRLKQLDKRYRTNYSMSMIENLDSIKKSDWINLCKMKMIDGFVIIAVGQYVCIVDFV